MYGLNDMIDVLFGGKYFQDIANTLNFKTESYWGLISSTFNNVILPVGYTLLCLYFLLELLERTTHEHFNLEQFMRLLIKLLIGKLMMDNCMALLDGLTSFANILSSGISKNVVETSLVNAEGLKTHNLKFWEEAMVWLRLVIPYTAMIIANLLAKITIYSRAIELIVRTLMAPIGMADIFAEGMRGAGFRYLKKFLAVNLQGAIILVIVMAMNFFNQSLVTEKYYEEELAKLRQSYSGHALQGQEYALKNKKVVLTNVSDIPGSLVITSILSAFVTVTMIQKSKEIASEVVGV